MTTAFLSLLEQCGYDTTQTHPECFRNFSWVKLSELCADLAYCRPEVVAFAKLMETELRANDHKTHWRHSSASWLLNRTRQELRELERVAERGGYDPLPIEERKHIASEAADVANFAMMVADVCGALTTSPLLAKGST